MKSIHLKHIFETLTSDINLMDTTLFFNEDGSVNRAELYRQLRDHGVTQEMLNTAINQRDTTILLNKYDIPIATVEETTIGDMVVKWLSMGIHDNTIITFEDRWSADNPPVLDAYLDPMAVVWRPITGDIPTGNRIDQLIEGCDISVRGLSCTYGKIDVSAVRAEYNRVPTYVDGDGVQHYYDVQMSRNAFLTIFPSGKVDRYAASSNQLSHGPGELLDVARLGTNLYGFTSAHGYLFKISGPWDGIKQGFGHTSEDPNFNCQDTFGTDWSIITAAAVTIIANKLYAAIEASSHPSGSRMFKYDMLNSSLEEIPNSADYPFRNAGNAALDAAEFISGNRIIYYNGVDYTICCDDIDTQTPVWDIPAPQVVGEENYRLITGMSYDPINNYLYASVHNNIVRYTCP